MITNKYPGRCAECSDKVAAGRGFATKRDGRWAVLCADCVPVDSESDVPVTRTLDALGRVTTPYDPEALPVLRSAPGARWDGDAKIWRWSVADADLARTLDCADALCLDVAPELRARLNAGSDETRAADARIDAIEARAGVTLYPYQRDGVKWLSLRARALLGDDMGLGKTIQTLAALPEGSRVVVVAPASLLRNWANECERWRPDLTPVVVRGRGALARKPAAGEVVIGSYESIPAASEPGFADVVIVDEAHRVKNYRAKRSKAVAALSSACEKAWFLTGTPLPSRPLDLWGVLSALGAEKEAFGSFSGFCRAYNGHRGAYGLEFGSPNAEAPEKLRRVMLRRRKDDVLTDLPAKIRSFRDVPVSGELSKELDAKFAGFSEALEAGYLPPFEEMAEVRAALAAHRVPATVEIVEEYEATGEPVIVFSAHRAPVDALRQREGWASITGDTDAEARARIVDAFQAGELRGVALTIAAGGVGLTLTRSSNVIFVDRAWTPADNVQAEDRAHRIGQRNAVSIVILRSSHPLDERVSEILEGKVTLIDAAIERRTELTEEHCQAVDAEAERRAKALVEAVAAVKAVEQREAVAKVEGLLARECERAGVETRVDAWDIEQRAAIREGLSRLRGVCDGAQEKDGCGFSKPDAYLGWLFAETLTPDASDRAYSVAAAVLRRYSRTQLDAEITERVWGAAA